MHGAEGRAERIEVAERVRHVGGAVGGEGLVEAAGDPDIVDDEPMPLMRPRDPVRPRDRLQQVVLAERVVQVHDRRERRVKTGEQLVAGYQEREWVVRALEGGLDLGFRLAVQVVTEQVAADPGDVWVRARLGVMRISSRASSTCHSVFRPI